LQSIEFPRYTPPYCGTMTAPTPCSLTSLTPGRPVGTGFISMSLPGFALAWCQVASTRLSPLDDFLMHALPCRPIIHIPEVPVPTVMFPSASASQLHPTQMQTPPGAWARASGSLPPVRHPTCQHPCIQPFSMGHCAQKSLEFCGLAHLSLLAGRCHHWAEATFLRSQVLIRGANFGLQAPRMLSGPANSSFTLVLRHPGPAPSLPSYLRTPPARLTEPHKQTHLTRSLPN
jgi:hypothetical protein